ncbi:ABC transporter permease, partial [Acidobacteriota bacterium]
MVKNILTITLRNLLKNRLNSLIIIFGLSTGILCTILSFLYIHDELSFDKFHKNLKDIYEVKMVLSLPMGRAVADPKAITALDITQQFPEVIRAVRIEKKNIAARANNAIYEEKALVADPDFMDMFTFPLKYGDSTITLRGPDSIVLSEKTANKYFGEQDPVGETLSLRLTDEFSDFVVGGVLQKIPDSSSLNFDILINIEKVYGSTLNDPQNRASLSSFIQLEKGKNALELQEKFKTSIDQPLKERFSNESGHILQPLADFHLRGEFGSLVLNQKSTIKYSLILAVIALLVMIIACFNFMNLSIGRASLRIKEIGVRKVLGAQRKQLIKQFWFESLMYSFISLIVALVMVELCFPAFNRLSQKNLRLDLFSNEWTVVFFVGLVFLIGIAAGSYPALVLSKFSSVDL